MFKPFQNFALTVAGVYGVMRALQMAPVLVLPEYLSSGWGLGVFGATLALLVLGIGLIWQNYASFKKEDVVKDVLPVGIALAGGLMIIAGISGAISQVAGTAYMWHTNLLSQDDVLLVLETGLLSLVAHVLRVLIGAFFLIRTESVAALIRKM